jgi:hypothetical protein
MSRIKNAYNKTVIDYKALCKPIPSEMRIALRTLWYGFRDIVVSLGTLITVPALWLLSSTIILVVVFLRNYFNDND